MKKYRARGKAGIHETRRVRVRAIRATAVSVALAATLTAPIASADDIGTCLDDMSAEWRACQYLPDGPIAEDSPQWHCATMGNRVCGPDNANGLPAGCYSDSGHMVAAWPCHIVVNRDGTADVYTGALTLDAGAFVGGYN